MLQQFGEVEVPDEDLVDEADSRSAASSSPTRVSPETPSANRSTAWTGPSWIETTRCPPGQQVDLMPDQTAVVVGLERLEDEVVSVGLAAEVGLTIGLRDPGDVALGQAHVTRERLEVVVRSPVEIDHRSWSAVSESDRLRTDLDIPVLAVRLEQATLDDAQRTTASRSAPATATRRRPRIRAPACRGRAERPAGRWTGRRSGWSCDSRPFRRPDDLGSPVSASCSTAVPARHAGDVTRYHARIAVKADSHLQGQARCRKAPPSPLGQ